MDQRTFNRLKTQFPGSSWAIWSNEFPDKGCIEADVDRLSDFIESRSDQLNPSIILLSLNPSGGIPTGFSNFHSPKGKHYDDRLKEYIQENGLDKIQGGYMTDLVPNIVDPDSQNIEPENADVDRFLKQLDLLDKTKYDVICFTGKAFEALRRYFDADVRDAPYNIDSFETTVDRKAVRVYRVWFYGLYGIHQDKVSELETQLEYLNDEAI